MQPVSPVTTNACSPPVAVHDGQQGLCHGDVGTAVAERLPAGHGPASGLKGRPVASRAAERPVRLAM